jgi:hypothetical protein
MVVTPVLLALLAVVLGASPAPPVKLAVPGLNYANVDEKTGAAFLDYFCQQLAARGAIQVTSQAELATVMGLERQRQLLACSGTSGSCIAELTGALGVDGLITGSLAKVGSGFLVNLKVVSTKDAHTLAVFSTRVRDEEALLDFLGASAKRLVQQLAPDAPVAPAPAPAPPPSAVLEQHPEPVASRSKAWVWPAAAGGALLATGATLIGLAHDAGNRILSADPSLQTASDVQSLRSTGEGEQAAGLALGGAGIAALAVSAGIFVTTSRGAPAREAWWMPVAAGGACAVASGVLFGVAKADESSIRSGASSLQTLDQVDRLRSAGSMAQTASGVLAGAAVVGVGAGLALRWLGPGTSVAGIPTRSGAVLAVGGTF